MYNKVVAFDITGCSCLSRKCVRMACFKGKDPKKPNIKNFTWGLRTKMMNNSKGKNDGAPTMGRS